MDCTCFWTPEHTWTKHYGAVEPGSQMEPNPECPVHALTSYKTQQEMTMDAPKALVGRVLQNVLLDHFDTYDLADILGNVLEPDEVDEYQTDDDEKWEELAEAVGDDVRFALRELWKTIAKEFAA